jgi:hypothetical protein
VSPALLVATPDATVVAAGVVGLVSELATFVATVAGFFVDVVVLFEAFFAVTVDFLVVFVAAIVTAEVAVTALNTNVASRVLRSFIGTSAVWGL